MILNFINIIFASLFNYVLLDDFKNFEVFFLLLNLSNYINNKFSKSQN